MDYLKGQHYEHPAKPEWGVGKVIDISSEGKLHIDFQNVGLKILVKDAVRLKSIEVTEPVRQERRPINYEKVNALCDSFYLEMAGNRRNTDDGSVALAIKNELARRGDLTMTTKRRLLAWCHTDGNPFQKGVPLARQICVEIYGNVPPRVIRDRARIIFAGNRAESR